MQVLLDNRANIESKDEKQARTPLSFEAMRMLLLLDEGAAMESIDNDGRTPLWWANWGGHMAVARLLAGLASSASVMNTQQIPRRLRVGKEDARRFLCNLGLFHATQQT